MQALRIDHSQSNLLHVGHVHDVVEPTSFERAEGLPQLDLRPLGAVVYPVSQRRPEGCIRVRFIDIPEGRRFWCSAVSGPYIKLDGHRWENRDSTFVAPGIYTASGDALTWHYFVEPTREELAQVPFDG